MPIVPEDPTLLTTAESWCAVRARNLGTGDPGSTSTYLASEILKPLNDNPGTYGARKRPDLLDQGTISRRASDPFTGQLTPTTQTLLVADGPQKYWAALRDLHGANFNDAEFWHYLTSNGQRLAGGDPRLRHHGFIGANPLTDAFGMQLVITDILGHSKRAFVKNLQIPQRVIRGANYSGTVAFPNWVDPNPFQPRAVPFSLGPCIAKLPTLYGAVPAICLNEFTMADATTWVLGLLVGNDAKNGIASLFQPKDANDVGGILDADPDVKWPGQTTAGWATINPSGAALYTVISSERFLLFAVKAGTERAKAFQDNSRPIYANFKGPTTTADGTGTEMTDAHVLKPWALKNFLLRTPGYLTGSYYTTFPSFDYYPGGATIPTATDASFTRSLGIANGLGGIKWGGIVGWHGDQSSVDDILASLNRSSLSMLGWSGLGQLTDLMFDWTRATFLRTATILTVLSRLGITADPKFAEEQKTEWFTDNLHLSFAFEGRDNRYVGDVQLPGSGEQFLSHGSIVREFTAPYIVDTPSATIVCQAMLDLFSFQIPSLSKWPRTWAGVEDDLGDGRAITHIAGNGGAGYVDAAHWILGQDDAIAAGRVINSGLFVEPVF